MACMASLNGLYGSACSAGARRMRGGSRGVLPLAVAWRQLVDVPASDGSAASSEP